MGKQQDKPGFPRVRKPVRKMKVPPREPAKPFPKNGGIDPKHGEALTIDDVK